MTIIQKIILPFNDDAPGASLCINNNSSTEKPINNKFVPFKKKHSLNLNSFFNSFYAKFYLKYTDLNSFYYSLDLEGDFSIEICAENLNNNETIIQNIELNCCESSKGYTIKIPDLTKIDTECRIYLKIQCLSNAGKFFGGYLATDQNRINEVFLAIIICTFKKEGYIKKTIKNILINDDLKQRNFKLFVIDNGKTLSKDEISGDNISLIPNRNVGGSGGFTRGLIEAIEEDQFTHFLFMDDDIELEVESILRLISFYEYAKSDIAVAGSLLDLNKKYMLYESGALYCKDKSYRNRFGLGCTPLQTNLNLSDSNNLNNLLKEFDIDYGGFWFFSFSKKAVEQIGLPLPLFKKVDDMEYGLRLKKYSKCKIIALPGIAVWHRIFLKIDPPIDNYYYLRNNLINQAIHFRPGYFKSVLYPSVFMFVRLIRQWDPKILDICLLAIKDFYKGPDFIKNTRPEDTFLQMNAFIKNYKDRNVFHKISLFFKCFFKWIKIICTSRKNWYRISKEWQDSSSELMSIAFWKQFLKE